MRQRKKTVCSCLGFVCFFLALTAKVVRALGAVERSPEAQTNDELGHCFDLASVEMQLFRNLPVRSLCPQTEETHFVTLSAGDLPKQESVVSIRIPTPVFETDRFLR